MLLAIEGPRGTGWSWLRRRMGTYTVEQFEGIALT